MSDPSDSWVKRHPWWTLAFILIVIALLLWLLLRKGGTGQGPVPPASLVSAWNPLP